MKRLVFALVLLLLPALPTWAAEDVEVSPLTPGEIADGWILLFDGKTTFGWHAPEGAHWTVFDGTLYPEAESSGPLVTTTEFAEFELKVQFLARENDKARLLLGCDAEGRQPEAAQHSVSLQRMNGDHWCDLTVTVDGKRIHTEARSSSAGAAASASSETTGSVGRGHLALAGSGIAFRTIKLRPLNMKPLFNGKDLSGWKEFPGKKSKFAVNDHGELTIQDGPGDLQTEDQWADFLLQIDCQTHGKNLNSGVFFRCRPGEYQNGYEAQIHNGVTAEPSKEYTVEEYDPETHKLLSSKKVKSRFVDYGTGSIYRRIPARFPVARDNEWFTMTVAANGPHLAVWVDGLQVTDWTDNRPPKDNARNGCRLEKGPISLQGHDTTTDLSFRNIRLQELPPAEKK